MSQDEPIKKKLFRKKSLRPWKADELEQTISGSAEPVYSALENTPLDAVDGQLEDIRKQIERSLEEKTKQKDALSKQIEPLSAGISFGGFIDPTNLMFHQEESLRKTKTIITELKDKEQEILELTNNLKTTRALEQIELAEMAREAEERARLIAEEKAKSAFLQASEANERIEAAAAQTMLALKQAEVAERERLQEIEDRIIIEEKLRNAIRQVQLAEENRNAAEKARNVSEEKIRFALEHAASIEKLSKDQVFSAETKLKKIECELLETKRINSDTLEHNRILEARMIALVEENSILSNNLSHEKDTRQFAEQRIDDLVQEIKNLKVLEDKLREAAEHIDKIETIIKHERGLRKLYEEKANYALEQAYNSEILRKAEEQSRKISEEKAKRAVEQASKAVMHFLNNEDSKLS